MSERCRHCGSEATRLNGLSRGTQRFLCHACGRTFTDRARRFGTEAKVQALRMHLNNVGIRTIALFLGCAPASVVNWIRAAHRDLSLRLRQAADEVEAGHEPDVIAMDEIYTFVQKKRRAVVWTAYSWRQACVVAFHIGDRGVESAMSLYAQVKARVPAIALVCTDANSCYRLAFARNGVPELHIETKARTHLIESSNASIRDTLARFNRRSKRHSKSRAMLHITLDLFFQRHSIPSLAHET